MAQRSTSIYITRQQRFRWGLILGGVMSVLILLISQGNLLTSVRLSFNNIYFVPRQTQQTVVIVALDNASLNAYGRSPLTWPRSLYGDLMAIVSEGGARVVAFDILFAEETPDDAGLAEAILAARQSESRTRTIIPRAGTTIVEVSPYGVLRFENTLTSVQTLREVADREAYVNTIRDVDTIVRRQPSLIDDADSLYLSFSMATFTAYSGIPTSALTQLLEQRGNRLYITPELTPNRYLEVDRYGFWEQNYFGTAPETFSVYSFKDVLEGTVDPSEFEEKIVLVGLINAAGATDQYNAPLGLNGRSMAGVEIHANAIETLLQESGIRQVSTPWKIGILIILTFLATLIYVQLRWYQMLGAAAGLLSLFMIGAFVTFDLRSVRFDLLDGVLAIVFPMIGAFGINLTTEIIQRRRTEFLLGSVVELSQQQLSLERILPLIADDVQRVMKTKSGVIWLWDEARYRYYLAHEWRSPASMAMDLLPTLSPTQQAAYMGDLIGLPIRWQGKSLAWMGLEPEATRLSQGENLALLEAFAQQIAPSLANAQLFSQVEEQRQQLQAIQDVSPNGLMLLDQGLHLVNANPRMDDHLAMPLDPLVGHPLADILKLAGIQEENIESLLRTFGEGQALREEMRLDKRSFYLYAVPLVNSWVVILNDITSLMELNDLKTQMIRMASHDLKNPIGVIMGYLELLMDEPDVSENTRRTLDILQGTSHHMLQIVEDILNLEQLRAGKVQKEPINFVDVVQEALEHHRGTIHKKQQTLKVESPSEPVIILGDQRLLVQAITNLVGNASKYTPDEGTVTVRVMSRDGKGHFEVQDTGYGIPASAVDKLFSQFYRVRTASTSHIRGTGLGLSLVKSIIEDHEGTVGVSSVEGEGSTFWVDLPLVATSE